MFGNIINAILIVIGSLIGFFFRGIALSKFGDHIIKALSLCIMLIGLQSALKGTNTLLLILSMVIGCIIGELLRIEDRLEALGKWLEGKFKGEHNIATGFVSSSLIYCIGAMAVMGALEGGLLGKHDTLIAKGIIDGISAIFFTASLGIGVLFSSVSVFVYQGSIVLLARYLSPYLSEMVVGEMSSVGGLLILGIGINMLFGKKIRVGNLLPAIFLPILYYAFFS